MGSAAGGAVGPDVGGGGRFAGMVAVVTGASRGLGAGMAEVFAAEGMRLGLCARTVPAVPEGALAVSVSVDVSEAGALDRFAGQVIDAFGRIDLWINNAGVLAPIGPLVHADPDEVSGNIGINLVGTANGTAAFGRHVRSRPGGGLLVNISSGAANRAYEGWAAYCASKAGVEMLTEVVSLEEQKSGLRAYALAPGVVDTDMQAMVRSTPDDRFPAGERFRRLHNEGRLGTPGWVARYVLDELLAPGDRQGDQPKGVRRRVPDQ